MTGAPAPGLPDVVQFPLDRMHSGAGGVVHDRLLLGGQEG